MNIKNIENEIKNNYNNSKDIAFKNIKKEKDQLLIVYIQSLTDDELINSFILKTICKIKELKDLEDIIPASNIKIIKKEEIYEYLSNAYTLIFNDNKIIAVETKKDISRAIGIPETESTITGPKDSFNENYLTNIGLIRKRIKTPNLVLEETVIGKQTKTKVGILYMNNIIEKSLLDEVNKKLSKINIDGIIDATYIKNIISKEKTFALLETTERPDLASMQLLEGKIIIVVDNSPFAIIIPTFFKDLFQSPEDNYQIPQNVALTKIIRYISFFISILTPAFYLAITTHNHETIPTKLLINFATQRQGVPFPAIVEALILFLAFEILRESDIRMPKFSGSSISILGALVLGDAAVTAGIVSPIMVIVIAISSIASLMFSHVAMINAIRIWKLFFMILATIFGIPGIFVCSFLLITYLCSKESFGKPYLYPFAPFNKNMFFDALAKKTLKTNNKRNPLLTDKNYTRNRL